MNFPTRPVRPHGSGTGSGASPGPTTGTGASHQAPGGLSRAGRWRVLAAGSGPLRRAGGNVQPNGPAGGIMNIIRKIVTAGVATLPIGGVAATMAATAAPASTAPVAVSARPQSRGHSVFILEPNYSHGPERGTVLAFNTPQSHFQLTEGPSGWVAGTHWRVWNNSTAIGTGRFWVSDVGTWTQGRVRVLLTRPHYGAIVNGHNHKYFTRLRMIGAGVTGYYKWYWSSGGYYR